MKRMSKNKWVLDGIVAFASIALISTGFAAWQIGLSTTSQTNTVNVAVDGVKNDTVLLSVTLSDSSITLADTSEVNEGYVRSDGNGDFGIAGTVRLEVSKSYLESNTINSVDFSFVTGEGYVSNCVTDTTNGNLTGFHDDSSTTLASLTYFDLVTTSLAFPTVSATDGSIATSTAWAKGDNNGNNYVYTSTIASTTTFFKWGTYFGNSETVSAFYNGKIGTATNSLSSDSQNQEVTKLLSYVESELTAMYTQLNGEEITLKAELNVTANSASNG